MTRRDDPVTRMSGSTSGAHRSDCPYGRCRRRRRDANFLIAVGVQAHCPTWRRCDSRNSNGSGSCSTSWSVCVSNAEQTAIVPHRPVLAIRNISR